MSPKIAFDKREQYLQDRRQHILMAAIEVFGRKGFDGANVADIAEAAEVGKGTVYLYFKSKDEIFRAILENYSFMPELLDVLKDIDAPIEQTLAEMLRRYLHFVGEHRTVIRILLLEGQRFLDEPSQIYTQVAAQATQTLGAYLQAQIEAGRVRPLTNPALTARAITGLMITHILLQETLGGKFAATIDEEAWIAEILEFTLDGIRQR
jgi:AcrR family transcriptional regulator